MIEKYSDLENTYQIITEAVVNDNWEALDEGFFKKLAGAGLGFVAGPAIGRAIAKALGVQKGLLYDMLTSRLVTTAIAAKIADSIGKK